MNKNGIIKNLLSGEVVALPTETVFGIFSLKELGADNLKRAKPRGAEKYFTEYILPTDKIISKFGEFQKYLPGPLTVIYKNQGYRISNNKILQEIINKVGPLLGTSANLSLKPPVSDSDYIEMNIPILRGECELGIESTVVSYEDKKVLRSGYIDLGQEIEKLNQFDIRTKFIFNKELFSETLNIDLNNIEIRNFWNIINANLNQKKPVNLIFNRKETYLDKLIYSYIKRMIIC